MGQLVSWRQEADTGSWRLTMKVFRLLKPVGRLVAMEYVTLPGWKPDDPEHQELMRLIARLNRCKTWQSTH